MNVLSARRKGSLMDDMGKLADANSSVATLVELVTDLRVIKERITKEI